MHISHLHAYMYLCMYGCMTSKEQAYLTAEQTSTIKVIEITLGFDTL